MKNRVNEGAHIFLTEPKLPRHTEKIEERKISTLSNSDILIVNNCYMTLFGTPTFRFFCG